jgi:hypothetical protein
MTATVRAKPARFVQPEVLGPLLAGDVARAWALQSNATIALVTDVVRDRAARFDEPCAATVALAEQLGVEGIVREARAKCATDKHGLVKMHVDQWDGVCTSPAYELALMVEDLVECAFCECREAHWRHKEYGFPCEPAIMQPVMQAEHEADKERWKPGTPVHDGRWVITRSGISLDEHTPTWFRWTDNLGLSSYHSASGSHFWDAGDDRTRLAKCAHWYIEETQADFVVFDLFGSASRDEVKIAAFAADVRARESARRAELGLPLEDDVAIESDDDEDAETDDVIDDEFADDDFADEEDEETEAALIH